MSLKQDLEIHSTTFYLFKHSANFNLEQSWLDSRRLCYGYTPVNTGEFCLGPFRNLLFLCVLHGPIPFSACPDAAKWTVHGLSSDATPGLLQSELRMMQLRHFVYLFQLVSQHQL